MLTPPRRGSGEQGDSSVHRRRSVIHHDSEVQENQGAGVGIIESVQGESESADHSQPPPPQNHESQESTSQWRSWTRSRFSVSMSWSSVPWRRRQDQGRNQENQEEINQRQSHLYLQASKVMSYVLFYSFFCDFVIFLFSSLHPSDQPSVQKPSAQPFVTEAVFDSTSESELSASVASVASLKQVTSAITSTVMAAMALKAAQDAAASALDHPQPSDDVVMVSADPTLIVNGRDQPAVESAEVRTDLATSGLTISGASAPNSLVKLSWHHCHRQGWTCVTCQMTSSCSHQTSRHQMTHSTSRGSWKPRISVIGSSSTMRSSSSISSITYFKFLESRSQLICSIGRSIKAFRMQSIT